MKKILALSLMAITALSYASKQCTGSYTAEIKCNGIGSKTKCQRHYTSKGCTHRHFRARYLQCYWRDGTCHGNYPTARYPYHHGAAPKEAESDIQNKNKYSNLCDGRGGEK